MTDVYRHCASIVVFRRTDSGHEVLLLRKPRKVDAWQLPQGGIEEGETVVEAALRELGEEAGITADVLTESPITYQYDFPDSYRKARPDNVCGQRISFVLAQFPAGQVIQVDNNEINSHTWAIPDQFSHFIKRKEYLKIVKKLVKEGEKLLKVGVR